MDLCCFKAYDIRGRVPDELDEDLALRIGAAVASMLDAGPAILGHDVRLTSPALQLALATGLMAHYASLSPALDHTDGVSADFGPGGSTCAVRTPNRCCD